MLLARNGEQLLLTVAIPVLLLGFFGLVDVLPSGDMTSLDFLVPGVLSVAIMSSAMVSLGIATGFERSYLVLKRLEATPLTRGELIISKILSVFVVQILQAVLLLGLGIALGWNASGAQWFHAIAGILLGTAAFSGIGLFLAGQLKAEINLAAQNGLYLVLLLLGGMIIPTDSLPGPLSTAASVLPSTALATILRSALSTQTASISNAYIVLAVWAVTAPFLAARRFRWS